MCKTDISKATPLFKQYYALKKDHMGAILLFRLGDFYEMFGADAEAASRILGITLTSRRLSNEARVPMCGVPHHSIKRYIKRLIEAGLTVAVADQVEDASEAKGIVRREVTRVIMPGTIIEEDYLDEGSLNYLAVVTKRKDRIGFAVLESSGGIVHAGEMSYDSAGSVANEIESRGPRELKLSPELMNDRTFSHLRASLPKDTVHETGEFPSEPDLVFFAERQFNAPLKSLGIEGKPALLQALFEIIRTLQYSFKVTDLPLTLVSLDLSDHMVLDGHTITNLEILASPYAGGEALIDVFARPKTGMGKRMLTEWLRAPLRNASSASERLDAVQSLQNESEVLDAIQELLTGICDIERIANRAGLDRTNPRELAALRESLKRLSELSDVLNNAPQDKSDVDLSSLVNLLARIAERLGAKLELAEKLALILAEEPPVNVSDGGVIAEGFSAELDDLRKIIREGKNWFLSYQKSEAERSGIRSLKVKYTGAFGYFIEVSNANLHLVPKDYTRKQTLVNAERFTTSALSEHELKLSSAEEDSLRLETELFNKLVSDVANERDMLMELAQAVGMLDVLASFAVTAERDQWMRPEFVETCGVDIKSGRHPMVERAVGRNRYVANDVVLSPESQQIVILTGPNMGGKSTYMRMVAHIVLLAHAGSFVPAESARIGVTDRIFTRIGASDALAIGQSTFMMEMIETAEILRTATNRSLVILDEVGRGTGTYDGLSIAKAVVEYLHEHPRARPLTLFATHYFELTELASILPRVMNLRMEVLKEGDEFVFLYAVEQGFADESYGIEVARLAGLPEGVVLRARRILEELEEVKHAHLKHAREIIQLGLFEE